MWILFIFTFIHSKNGLFDRCIHTGEFGQTFHLTCIHGICIELSDGNRRCACSYGYSGRECSNPNMCLLHPDQENCDELGAVPSRCTEGMECLNGGFCDFAPASSVEKIFIIPKSPKNVKISARCVCPIGFHGEYCETKVNGPCLKCHPTNTEKCEVFPNNKTENSVLVSCQCRKGTYGPFCQFINETNLILCKDGDVPTAENGCTSTSIATDFCCDGLDCERYCRNSTIYNTVNGTPCPERVCPSPSYTFMPRCLRIKFCQLKFADGICDPDCNQEDCLYDGGDCNTVNPCMEKEFCLLSNPYDDSFEAGCDSKICHNMSCVFHSDNFCFEHNLLRLKFVEIKVRNVMLLVFLGGKNDYYSLEIEILRSLSQVLNIVVPHAAKHLNGSEWIQELNYDSSSSKELDEYNRRSLHLKPANTMHYSKRNGADRFVRALHGSAQQSSRSQSLKMIAVGYYLDPANCIGAPCVSDPSIAAQSIVHVSAKRKIFPLPIITAKTAEEFSITFDYFSIFHYVWVVILSALLLPLIASGRIRKWTAKKTWYPTKYRQMEDSAISSGGPSPKFNVMEENSISQQATTSISIAPLGLTAGDLKHTFPPSTICINGNPMQYTPGLGNVLDVDGFHPLFYLYYHNQIFSAQDIVPYLEFINKPICKREISILMCAVTPASEYQHTMQEMIVEATNSRSERFSNFSSKLLRDSHTTLNSSPTNHYNLTKLLLDLGADVHMVTSDTGETALHFACKNADLAVIRLLITSGANVNHQDFQGRTSFHVAASNCFYDTLRMLIEEPNANVNLRDINGLTALMDCSSRSLVLFVKLLLKSSNVDVNLQNQQNMTALHMAASIGNFEICHLLLQYGASASIVDSQGRSPAVLAKMNGHTEVCKLLNVKTVTF